MANKSLVKFYKINNSQLSSLPITEGQLIVVQDTGKMYIDISSSNRVQIEGPAYGLSIDGRQVSINKDGGNSSINLPIDGNTTYSFAQDASDGHKILITPSDGSGVITLTIPDNDTTYSEATSTASGLMSSTDKIKLTGIESGANKTIVDTLLNETSSNPIANNAVYNALEAKLDASLKGANNGVAELGADGKVPSSQLPSYVDDVLEYANKASFPATGESGKIYIALDTNLTYRWSGSAYVEISASLALGETSSTAYRGDLGAAAYAHAVTNKGIAAINGLYKFTTNSEGHITAVAEVQKADITGLGIPAQDTTYDEASTTTDGLMSADDKIKLDGIATGANKTIVDTTLNASSANPIANSAVVTALNQKLEASDITVTQTLTSGAEVGKVKVGNTTTTLYAPETGTVSTELAKSRTVYHLTGVTDIQASENSQLYNTRVSHTHTGVQYETSTSVEGGTLTVDGREVTLGLYYKIA